MRTVSLLSLVFAFLTSFSVGVSATPNAKLEASTTQVVQVTAAEQVGKVKLNVADAETLKRDLFGIGSAKAKAIIAYRESNGPFTSVDELLEVKGIGKALLEKNRERLEVN